MRHEDWPQEIAKPKVLANFRPNPTVRTERPLSYQKRRDGNDPNHLALLRRCTCLLCFTRGCDPHHLKTGPASIERAFGRRATDQWTVPLCRMHHDEVERVPTSAEPDWFDSYGFPSTVLYYIPLRLWRETRNVKDMRFDDAVVRLERIIAGFKRDAIHVLADRRKQQRR